MKDCCEEPRESANAAVTATSTPLVVLAGNPNSGKSTLFNRLTGSRQRVINAPRTTVELALGTWRDTSLPGTSVRLVDLPGAYDIVNGSPDETLTGEVLASERLDGQLPDLAVVTIDATAPGRSLYLLAQLAQRSMPAVLAVTMADVAASRGTGVDPALLAELTSLPVTVVDPRTGAGLDALAAQVARSLTRPASLSVDAGEEAALEWAHATTVALGAGKSATRRIPWSDKADRALLHPWVGIPLFMAVLWATFQLITWVAAPLIAGIDAVWQGPVLRGARWLIPGDGWWQSAVVDGVLSGVGTVLSFVPLMMLAFLAFAVLEDSGYLARASFVADKALRLIGLDGRAVLPLILGYGCNLPALAALKVLPDARQRLATALLIPFTSCTARLPVYLLLAAAFFPGQAGTAVFCLYLLSAVVVIAAGLVAKRTVLRGSSSAMTLTVLPSFQRPHLRSLGSSALTRSKAFVTQAGTVIVVALAAMWVFAAIPVQGNHDFAQVPVQDSAYAAGAKAAAPLFAPAGFDDWRATSALTTGLVAKELVVAAFAQSYALDDASTGRISDALVTTFDSSSGGHGSAAAAAFLVFVALYSPCVATMGELRRQFGWRWMATSVGLGIALAYAAAVATFTVGRLL